MKWILFVILSFALSFVVYRMTDEKLSDVAIQLSEPLPAVVKQPLLSDFQTDLSQFEKNLCANLNGDTEKFVKLWESYLSSNSAFFKQLLEVRIQTPISHSTDSILGHQDAMRENLIWIRHFEHHICYLELTQNGAEAVRLLNILISSVLKSFEIAQPFVQNTQSAKLLASALYEIEKHQMMSGFKKQIQNLDFEKISRLSEQFHFQSVINSLENLKSKMKLSPTVFLPSVMIQPGRLKNQMALISLDPEMKLAQANPKASWSDVQNLELIYLSLFQKSIKGQRERLETEVFSLKELATDLSRKTSGLENDNSGAHDTK